MTQIKRPRIDASLIKDIDTARGDVPFERWVNRRLEDSLLSGFAEFNWRDAEMDDAIEFVGEMMDAYATPDQWRAFKKAAQGYIARVDADFDRYAVEAEHEDDDDDE